MQSHIPTAIQDKSPGNLSLMGYSDEGILIVLKGKLTHGISLFLLPKVAMLEEKEHNGRVVIRNRLIAFSYRLLIFILFITAASVHFLDYDSFWEAISYPCMLLGVMTIVVFGFSLVFNLINLRKGIRGVAAGPYMPIALPIHCFSFLSGVVYFSYLLPNDFAPGRFYGIMFHVLLIFAGLVDWLFFCEKGTVRLAAIFVAQILPILFFMFGYFRPLIWPKTPLYLGYPYAYAFLDYEDPNIIRNAIIYFGACLGTCVLAVLLNNFLAGKYRKD